MPTRHKGTGTSGSSQRPAASEGGLLITDAKFCVFLRCRCPGLAATSNRLPRLSQDADLCVCRDLSSIITLGQAGGAVGGEIHFIILSHCVAPGASSAPLQRSRYRITHRQIIHLNPPAPLPPVAPHLLILRLISTSINSSIGLLHSSGINRPLCISFHHRKRPKK